jgi:hypothetical protein
MAADGGTSKRDRDDRDHHNDQHRKRSSGIQKAANKLAKEETELKYESFIEAVLEKKPIDAKSIIESVLAAKVEANLDAYAEVVAEGFFGEEIEEDFDLSEEVIEEILESFSDEELYEFEAALDALKEEGLSEAMIMEISKKTLGSYIRKASADRDNHTKIADTLHAAKHAVQQSGVHQGWHGSKKLRDTERDARDSAANYTSYAAQAHSNKANKRKKGIDRAVGKLTKEDFDDVSDILDQLDEVSKSRLAKYTAKAAQDNASRGIELGKARAKSDGSGKSYQNQSNIISKMHKRQNGINTAARKLATENEDISDILDQLDEVSKERLGKYINKAVRRVDNMSSVAAHTAHGDAEAHVSASKEVWKRKKGISAAVDKLTRKK